MAVVAWDAGRRKTLTIANAATETDILDLGSGKAYRPLDILVEGPAVLTGTVKVQVCSTFGGTFNVLQSGGADIAIPAAKATPLVPAAGCRFLKLVSSGAEGASRAFILTGVARSSAMPT